MAFRAKGDLTNARSDFDQAVSLNPNYARAYANRGNLAFAQRDFDGAIADFDQAIKLDADRCEPVHGARQCLRRQGRRRSRHRRL